MARALPVSNQSTCDLDRLHQVDKIHRHKGKGSRSSINGNSPNAMNTPTAVSPVKCLHLRRWKSSRSRQAARCNDAPAARYSLCTHPDTTVPVVIKRTSILGAVRRHRLAHLRAGCRNFFTYAKKQTDYCFPKPSKAGLDGNRPTDVGDG